MNTRAYNHYLVGNKHLRGTNNQKVFLDAVQSFEHAVEEDPEFALAWALLSRSHSAVYMFVDRTESRRKMARQAIDRAFEISPDLPEAHYAMGYFHYQCLNDTDAALREWDLAAQTMSGDSRIYLARSYVYRRIGFFEQAVASQNRAIALDPRNVEQLLIQWHTYASLRDYTWAKRIADRIIETVPSSPMGYYLNGYIVLWRDGDSKLVKAALDDAPMEFGPHWLGWVATLYQRNYDAVLNYLDGWKIQVDDRQNYYTPISFFYGLTYHLGGMPDLATPKLWDARDIIEQELKSNPEDPRLLIALGRIVGRQGEREKSIRLIRQAMELSPTSKYAARGPAIHMSAILAFLDAGEYDTALDELDAYLASPGVWSIEGLLPDPRIDPIRNDPRFTALVAKYGRKPG